MGDAYQEHRIAMRDKSITQLQAEVRALRERVEQVEAERDALLVNAESVRCYQEDLEQAERERDEARAERDALRERVEQVEAENERLRAAGDAMLGSCSVAPFTLSSATAEAWRALREEQR